MFVAREEELNLLSAQTHYWRHAGDGKKDKGAQIDMILEHTYRRK